MQKPTLRLSPRARSTGIRTLAVVGAFIAGIVLEHNVPPTEQVAAAVPVVRLPVAHMPVSQSNALRPTAQTRAAAQMSTPQMSAAQIDTARMNTGPLLRASFITNDSSNSVTGNLLGALPTTVVRPDSLIVTEAPALGPSPEELAVLRALAEARCLAQAMYYEARGEGRAGEEAIAEVIFHRMHAHGYPHSVCGVVFEGAGSGHGCQFSFACNGEALKPREAAAWYRARTYAEKIIKGMVHLDDLTEDAIAFHAVDVQPEWGDHLERTIQIGNHIFYRAAARTKDS